MAYIIDINKYRRMVVARLEKGESKRVYQTRGRFGQWMWDGTEMLNGNDTDALLIQHNKICPQCKSDTDERGRCEAQCYKRPVTSNF